MGNAITVNDRTLKAMGFDQCYGNWDCDCENCPFDLLLTDPEAVSHLQRKGYTVLYHDDIGMSGAFLRNRGNLLPVAPENVPL